MLSYPETILSPASFDQPISEQIWRSKYQYITGGKERDITVNDTWLRVANSLAQPEKPSDRQNVSLAFYQAMEGFKLLPAGRILAGSGTHRNVTLANTFVMRAIPDSVEGIMDTVKDAALTMQMGGGIGFDFSTLRPKGTLVSGLDCPAAGPLAAMDICNTVCGMLVTGMGRGAMMATIRVDHPDIEAFITAKANPLRLRNFNTSVMITDSFMAAVEENADWDLIWDGKPVRSVKARDIWEKVMSRTYSAAEPGVLFIDRINAANPLGYLEHLSSTNSCAEQPLPPNGTCPLASINLARLVADPFSSKATFDLEELRRLVTVAVRMLDNVIDVSRFAVEAQRREAQAKRRIGVGVTGVADALIMMGVRYGTPSAVRQVGSWLQTIQNAAYLASAELAAVRGAFPLYDAEQHLQRAGIQALDPHVRDAIAKHGLRNGVLTTIAPTGTTSMYGGNVSSGIEPVFATSYTRKITRPDGSKSEELIQDYAVWLYYQMFGKSAPLTDAFVTAQDLRPADHIRIQAVAQRWVDSGISKTVNCPEDIPFAVFEDVYRQAFDSGCKGCTTYRPNPVTGSILSA
ncbi:adenosylcobalamin-dependent ribonucleoside-diphosphate reductase [uncultured Roseobacter sp.]|uniref:adenosylcobalamin-dependent ribonucleoside-diphosphate reductase n=1 Tax=uncultured Roseobacter sp. TaxID=114847 RepID=UPI00262B0315|nr:adenosylcobalamin-dependent ribonucleoside-diphosphate reductase [uncultured Roseobacter sp.]